MFPVNMLLPEHDLFYVLPYIYFSIWVEYNRHDLCEY